MASHFGDRLYKAVKSKKTPLIVGLDPVYGKLPAVIRQTKSLSDENDAAAAIDAIFEYSTKVLRVIAPLVPAVKINIAFFEKYLWEGIECYYSLISEAQELGLEIIGDVKRGDIGHTAENYAQAHLQNPELKGLEDVLAPDAITVNGFAGADGILPFADMANKQGKGIFVWVRASNPSAAAIQDFADASGVKMYEKLADIVNEIANEKQRISNSGYSNVGMVIGGTSGQQTSELREKYKHLWFLVPGFGSQGATAADCIRFCKPDGAGALISASRSIIYAYENEKYTEQFGENWEKCIEQAVMDTKVELAKAI
ncbi:MAG: orotidine-5'-phosphate decarboxylase [Planctomycetes bacterium HGW-Planctomycetes-1]|nr:MAG: orotidine-5'-phosphate decarboxylase [Planctomycetes bacterium HGW-Planctomycetes-1]